jgi:hypothetical protein
MIQSLQLGARKLTVIACTLLLVACAGTGEQGGYKQLTSRDVASVTQGMTKQEVEQALGRPHRGEQRDRQGNTVLVYRYAAPPGPSYTGTAYLSVTIDPASGKVIRVESETH